AAAGFSLLRLLVLGAACVAAAVGWYFLYRPVRSVAEEEDLPAAAQAATQIERDLIFEKRHNLLRLLNADIGMLMTSRIKVRHVMSENVLTVRPNTSAAEVRGIMQEHNIRHVLVCDNKERPLGLITLRRLLDAADEKAAAEFMECDPPTTQPNSLLSPAITQLIKQRLYCLPVVEGERLVGILTTTDVMMAMQCTLHALHRAANEVASDLPEGMVPGFMLALSDGENAESDVSLEAVGQS
ncbi:MAG: CBS domain-containing protein, partial [Planctomycetales bacterium]|nr:CBS domain-containing protein [Planctomycetales bacterium]